MTTRKYSSRSQQTTLAAGITDTATSCTVVSGSALLGGATVPAGTTFTVVIDPDTALEEIVDVTVVSTNVLTITRGVENAGTGQAHSAGAAVRHMAIGRDFREANLHIEATGGYNDGTGAHTMHGIAAGEGVVVGTDKTQTLTAKTLTSPVITNPTISGAGVDASIVFEGAVADAHETTLTVEEPTADRTITLPNATGTVVLAAVAQTLTNKTIDMTGVTLTGLSSAGMSASSATPKDYVDSILGSATSAATSAASAATSATSAATSATSAAASAATAAASATTSANSATAAATSATSAAASATAAATSATSAAASATTAANSVATIAAAATAATNAASAAATSATSASASATAAATSATSAAASATAAATSASSAAASAASIVGDAAAAATSAASASTSAASALTSATSAAASATTAANSVATIAGYATTASNSASAAATSAASASTSASSAATSAASASTSASSALTSATSAATSYDEFDDRYLGAKATPPTLDNDGNALITGALYWNTAVNKMYVWSGTAWGEISSSADIISYKYTVAGGATSVSGVDDNGLTLTYTVGKEQVYINGVLQVRGSDYTATTGSSITGITAMLASDIVTVLAFTAFSVSNTYTQAEADAKFVQQTTNYFAGKNLVNNGNMNISQRGTSLASLSTGESYLVDRFALRNNNLGTATFSQETDAPAGFKTSAKILFTTADATPAASDFSYFRHKIESQALQSLQKGTATAKPITISFWVKSNVTGTYILQNYDPVNARIISGSYSINTANTWEKKSITLVGDTSGALNNDNSTGLQFGFALGAGSDRTSGTLNTSWGSLVTANEQVGQVNVAAAVNNYWMITGVQIEIGSVATDWQLSSGTIAGELAACQRYLPAIAAVNGELFTGQAYTGTQAIVPFIFPVTPRVAPTGITVNSAGNFRLRNNAASKLTVTSMNFSTASNNSCTLDVGVSTGLTAGNASCLFNESGGTILFTGCEL